MKALAPGNIPNKGFFVCSFSIPFLYMKDMANNIRDELLKGNLKAQITWKF